MPPETVEWATQHGRPGHAPPTWRGVRCPLWPAVLGPSACGRAA